MGVKILLLKDASEHVAWDMYLACLVSMALHPGNYAKGPDFEKLGEMADIMVGMRRERLAERRAREVASELSRTGEQ